MKSWQALIIGALGGCAAAAVFGLILWIGLVGLMNVVVYILAGGI